MQEYKIEAKNITMNFGEKRVLDELSVRICEGEIFGLLGPSGAGKTTLIKILTGQLVPSGGSTGILGADSRKLDSSVYRRIGMVLDSSGLYERLNCRDNLVLFADIYRIPKSKIGDALAKVGLKGEEKSTVAKLSKGMKQRLVLARAILHEPDILFLDEPTSGLDPATANLIHSLIKEEKEKGTAIFLTTHNMEEAAKLCDHVGLLSQGKLVEYGEPEELCLRYNHQNRIRVVLKNGEQIELKNESASGETLSGYLKENNILSIHSTEPNLETVFMELTGRGLSL